MSSVQGGAVATAAGGSGIGVVAAAVTAAPTLPLLRAAARSVEGVLKAVLRFFVVSRARQEAWLMGMALPRLPQEDVLRLLAEEGARQAEFQRRVLERVRRDVTRALALDEAKRQAAVQAILRREQVYARQRAEAMAVRAFATVDRIVLRAESPTGALWELDRDAKAHTAGCRILGGHVLPWAVLDDVHPPFGHAGCRCRLRPRPSGRPVMDLRSARALVARALAAERAEHGH